MRTDIRCRHCQARLSVKAELLGKQIPCPRCKQPVKVALAPVVLASHGSITPPRAAMVVPDDDVPIQAQVLDDDPGFDVVPDDEPATQPAPPARRQSPPPEPSVAPRPKKKRKKKIEAKNDSYPAWVWALFVLGALITTSGLIFGLYMALRVGTPDGQPVPWKEYLIAFSVSVPITLVILIASMFISSALGGGINFGDAKTAIIGSIFLIVIVNVVALIPIVGRYLTLLVWLVGFMTIFGLDPWEARFLLFINWVLNFFVGYAMYSYVINKIERGGDDYDDDEPVRVKPRERNNRDKNRHKEDPDDDPDEMSYYRPDEWHDRIARWVDRRACCASEGAVAAAERSSAL